MKTFMTAFVLSTTVLAAQAQAFGPTMNTLTRDLTFPRLSRSPSRRIRPNWVNNMTPCPGRAFDVRPGKTAIDCCTHCVQPLG